MHQLPPAFLHGRIDIPSHRFGELVYPIERASLDAIRSSFDRMSQGDDVLITEGNAICQPGAAG